MRREDLMKPDLQSNVLFLSGIVIVIALVLAIVLAVAHVASAISTTSTINDLQPFADMLSATLAI